MPAGSVLWEFRILTDGLGNELRAQRRSADADEQDLLEVPPVRCRDRAGVDILCEFLERSNRLGDGFFQLFRRRETCVAQPVVTDHAAFIGVGDGAGLDRYHISEGFGDFRREGFHVIWFDVHQGEIDGKTELWVAEERLVVGLPGHGAKN
jgi:hypothetical protein